MVEFPNGKKIHFADPLLKEYQGTTQSEKHNFLAKFILL